MLGIETADHKLLSIQAGETGSEQGRCRGGGLNGWRDRGADFFTDERDAIPRNTVRFERRTRLQEPSWPDALFLCFFHLFSSLKKVLPHPAQTTGVGHTRRKMRAQALSQLAGLHGRRPWRGPKGLTAALQRRPATAGTT